MEQRLSNFNLNTNQRNQKIRDAICKYFTQRELLTLVRPVDDEEDLKRLSDMHLLDMREQF